MSSPSSTEIVARTPELTEEALSAIENQEARVIVFEDQRGIERRPHPDAPECYASPEIQVAVGEHFLQVDKELEEVTAKLDELNEAKEKGTTPRPFDPLTEELLTEIRSQVSDQLPGLTRKGSRTEEREVKSGRIFKRTKTETHEVEVDEPVDGYTVSIDDREHQQRWHDATYVPLRSEKVIDDQLQRSEQSIESELKDLLLGSESSFDEKIRNGAQRKLPLLAVKLRYGGLTSEDVAKLGWEDIERLVPELKTYFEDIHKGVERVSDFAVLSQLAEIGQRLRLISPTGCDTIARIYYDDKLIGRLQQLLQKVDSMRATIFDKLYPDRDHSAVEDDYLTRQYRSIAEFFDQAHPADTLLFHGTGFAPRIIASGFLKPAASMGEEEFTFSTTRTHSKLYGVGAGIEGSRGVHWAGSSGHAYAGNNSAKETERIVRSHLNDTYGSAVGLVDKELAKGGVGSARFTMRLGDIIAYTPYGGHRYTSSQEMRNSRQTPKPRFGIVELTPKGWKQIESKIDVGTSNNGAGIDDVAYIVVPEHRPIETLHQYAYPIEDMLIGIPARDLETIPAALRARGWSEEQIKDHTYVYSDEVGEGQALQQSVLEHPKFPHSVIATIRKDL